MAFVRDAALQRGDCPVVAGGGLYIRAFTLRPRLVLLQHHAAHHPLNTTRDVPAFNTRHVPFTAPTTHLWTPFPPIYPRTWCG